MNKTVVFVICWLLTNLGIGQVVDTVLLEELVVTARPMSSYATGAAVHQVNYVAASSTLGDLLEKSNAIYFKTYGNQQLATISFRGTTASHTNVLWHGLPANSPVLGQTDFSLWSGWLMDNIGLQPGSAGALYGSGSIGGTVFVDHFDGLSVRTGSSIRIEQGSFGKLFLGARTAYHGGKWSGSTKVYRDYIRNDFAYPLKGTNEVQEQENAAVHSYGGKQQIQYASGIHRVSADLMFNLNDRQVQPPISNQTSRDQLKTINWRAAVEYLADATVGTISTTVGYIEDDYTFNTSVDSKTRQFSLLTHLSRETDELTYRIGGLFNWAGAYAESYVNNARESRLEVFGSINWEVTPKWTLSTNLRQNFVINSISVFVPAISSNVTLSDIGPILLNWKVQVSSGYRYPTLNDRFWEPGGNPDLKAESSINAETGFDISREVDRWTLESSVTAYVIHASDWIIWLPQEGGLWSPDNIQNVRVVGTEFAVGATRKLGSGHLENKVSLTSQLSQNRSDFPTDEENGNQLPYVPFYTANWMTEWTWSTLSMHVNQHLNGDRFSTIDNSIHQEVSGYYLLDLGIDYSVGVWKSNELYIGLRINNLLNSYYENLINRAMPGINYRLHAQLDFKS